MSLLESVRKPGFFSKKSLLRSTASEQSISLKVYMLIEESAFRRSNIEDTVFTFNPFFELSTMFLSSYSYSVFSLSLIKFAYNPFVYCVSTLHFSFRYLNFKAISFCIKCPI